MAPDVTLGFSGIFATGAAYAGVAHPPGFPVWTLYSWLFVKLLPVSNIAWRVAVGSAVAAAMASGLVALMVSRGGKMLLESTLRLARSNPTEQQQLRFVCGCVAGMALAFSGPVWRKAVVADFWALSVFLHPAERAADDRIPSHRGCRRGGNRNDPAHWLGVEVGGAVRNLASAGACILLLPAHCLDDKPADELGLSPHRHGLFPRH
jgi:hypothetical protein